MQSNFADFYGPGASILKPIMAIIYEFQWYVSVFVSGKPFQPSLVFVGKVRSYLRVEHLKARLFDNKKIIPNIKKSASTNISLT